MGWNYYGDYRRLSQAAFCHGDKEVSLKEDNPWGRYILSTSNAGDEDVGSAQRTPRGDLSVETNLILRKKLLDHNNRHGF